MYKTLEHFDRSVIYFLREYADDISRFALFVIFFWFGILKVFMLSPAGPLVIDLMNVTFLKGIHPETFLAGFGIFEVLISIMILIPRLERITFLVLFFHLCTTVMPLIMLPIHVWDAPLVPNLTGQYIIKNIALLSLGLVLFARLKPMTKTHRILAEEQH
jgi:uncharacterized membrane protein YkgB